MPQTLGDFAFGLPSESAFAKVFACCGSINVLNNREFSSLVRKRHGQLKTPFF
jgi:hypothetical protein